MDLIIKLKKTVQLTEDLSSLEEARTKKRSKSLLHILTENRLNKTITNRFRDSVHLSREHLMQIRLRKYVQQNKKLDPRDSNDHSHCLNMSTMMKGGPSQKSSRAINDQLANGSKKIRTGTPMVVEPESSDALNTSLIEPLLILIKVSV